MGGGSELYCLVAHGSVVYQIIVGFLWSCGPSPSVLFGFFILGFNKFRYNANTKLISNLSFAFNLLGSQPRKGC